MQIIPVASGKGGVGKSLFSANLAVALGQADKKVVLADLDLGSSNLHLVLGHQSPKSSIGTFLAGESNFSDIIESTQYKNVDFIAGDSEIPGIATVKLSRKKALIHELTSLQADYLILDLGAGTHLGILDMFLLSPQGVLVTAPTVTATLNGYLFLKNAVFRLMDTTFDKGTKAHDYFTKIKKQAEGLQKMYIPKLVQEIQQIDASNAQKFITRLQQFKPRIVLNMIDDPKDADRASRIRRSCLQYLGIDIEHLGVMYRDNLQDKALSSRLPVIVYKPNCVLSQAIYRTAQKILQNENVAWSQNYQVTDTLQDESASFEIATEEAQDDYSCKIDSISELAGSGAFSPGELAEIIRTQQYEIDELKKQNLLLKSKIIKASNMGFKV